MYTYDHNSTTRAGRDPMFRLKQEMRIRNFSPKTIKAYLYYNNELLRFANPKNPLEIIRQDIRDYIDFLFNSGKSASTVNLAINALKFYYDKILGRNFFAFNLGIKRPKKEKKLPTVLSKQEIKKMLTATTNPKHKTMISLLYGCGLRISELVNLKMADIDLSRNVIHLRCAKGKKDRYVNVPVLLKPILQSQSYLKSPEHYLFTGRINNSKICVMSAQKAVKQALNKAGIKKQASPHSLRHSFATHLLESGTDIRYIQSLLGHARLETTQIYTKVAQNKIRDIGSPLDS